MPLQARRGVACVRPCLPAWCWPKRSRPPAGRCRSSAPGSSWWRCRCSSPTRTACRLRSRPPPTSRCSTRGGGLRSWPSRRWTRAAPRCPGQRSPGGGRPSRGEPAVPAPVRPHLLGARRHHEGARCGARVHPHLPGAPSDLVAAATFGQSGVRVLVGFTSDRGQLGQAIEGLGLTATQRQADPLNLAWDLGILNAVRPGGPGSGGSSAGRGARVATTSLPSGRC